jgi:hypothetical protein
MFVGVKLAGSSFFHVPTGWSLLVVALVIGTSVVLSLVVTRRRNRAERQPAEPVTTR